MMLNVARSTFFAIVMFVLVPTGSMAADDKAALAGLNEVKVGFDLKEGDGKLLLSWLDIIDETRQSLIQQGVKPHFIIAFRGPATKLVQTDPALIKPQDREMATKIAVKIKQMSARWRGDSLDDLVGACEHSRWNVESQ